VPLAARGQPRPGVAALAFGARPAGGDLPGSAGQQLERGVDAQLGARVEGDLQRARHAEHVADAVALAVFAQVAVAAVDRVACAPRHVGVRGHELGEQVQAQCGLGFERQVGGDAHADAGLPVGQLFGWYVQPGADQGVPGRGAVGGVDEVHRVGDLAGTANILAFHPSGPLTGLLGAALVEHQHGQPTLVGQVLHDEVTHHAHHREGVPRSPFQQPLHPVGSAVPGVLGKCPAVLAREVAEQPTQILADLLQRFHPREVRAEAADQRVHLLLHPAGPYHGRSGHLTIFGCPHNTR
jgi:hypothetical protein